MGLAAACPAAWYCFAPVVLHAACSGGLWRRPGPPPLWKSAWRRPAQVVALFPRRVCDKCPGINRACYYCQVRPWCGCALAAAWLSHKGDGFGGGLPCALAWDQLAALVSIVLAFVAWALRVGELWRRPGSLTRIRGLAAACPTAWYWVYLVVQLLCMLFVLVGLGGGLAPAQLW